MKLQHLSIIFIIIIVPISFLLSEYVQAQITTITYQTSYDAKLMDATYDAVKAFQLNTKNNRFATVSDSKIRDIESSINAFYNSLGTSLGASGYTQEELRSYVPAIVCNLYDGYYIYSRYKNELNNDNYEYGLKSYIFYSARYKNGDLYDFVVNYTLDNGITIIGTIGGEYVTISGYLIDPSKVSFGALGADGYPTYLRYDGVEIQSETQLQDYLLFLDSANNKSSESGYYTYGYYQGNKVYHDNTGYFTYNKNEKIYINNFNANDYYQNSAMRYYYEAYKFSIWANQNLRNITVQNLISVNGDASITNEEKIKLFGTAYANKELFVTNNVANNNPLLAGSVFDEHRIAVIRASVETSLKTAIAGFNGQSQTEYEFMLPVISEEDWYKIENEISISAFLQGMPIGSKYYNGYCVISNDSNKEFVAKDSIYVITREGEAHQANCDELLKKQDSIIGAYSNLNFINQNLDISETFNVYYYFRKETYCYNCLVNAAGLVSIDDLILGEIKNKNGDIIYNKDSLYLVRKAYLTALARERYELYKINAYFGYN